MRINSWHFVEAAQNIWLVQLDRKIKVEEVLLLGTRLMILSKYLHPNCTHV